MIGSRRESGALRRRSSKRVSIGEGGRVAEESQALRERDARRSIRGQCIFRPTAGSTQPDLNLTQLQGQADDGMRDRLP
jgi:hypothetical protein